MFGRYYAVVTPAYNTLRWQKKMTLPMAIFDIAILWYYSFSGSMVLRPMASFFWILMAIAGIVVFDMLQFPLSRYLYLGLASVGYMLVTALFSVDQDASLKYALSMLLYLIIAIEITSNHENIIFFFKVLFCYSLVLLIITYIQKFAPDLYLDTFAPLLPERYHKNVVGFMERDNMTGFFNQTSENALAMSIGVGLCVYRLIKRPRGKISTLVRDIMLLGAFLYGLILTVRRGSLLAVALILVYILYSYKRNYVTKILVTVSGFWLLFFGGINYIPALSNVLEKNTQYVTSGDVSNGRFEIWEECFEIFGQNPIFGIGADSLAFFLDGSSAHNSYIQMLAELGIIGFLLFFGPFVYGLFIGIRNRKNTFMFTREDRGLMTFSLFWQLFCFVNAVFEATLSHELIVFMLFVAQLLMIRLVTERKTTTRVS